MKFCLTILIWLLLAASSYAATALGTITTHQGTPGASSHTFSHSQDAGANLGLVVFVQYRTTGITSTGVTYNGVAMTATGSKIGTTAFDLHLYAWQLVAPATGANNVVVTLSGSTAAVITALSFTGVHQTDFSGTVVTTESTSASSSSIDVTSETDAIVVDGLGIEGAGTTPTVGASQTSRWQVENVSFSNSTDVVGSTEPGATTVTMSWTTQINNDFVHLGFSVNPAAVTAFPAYYQRRRQQ